MLESGSIDGLPRLLGKDHVAVLAAEPDRPFALGIDERDDLLVDEAGQNHLDDLDGGLVGDPQAAFELALDAHPGEHLADLRPAAMHHDGVHAGLLQERDVARKSLAERRVAHGVAAVFHHDGLVLVALHVGQRLGEQPGLVVGFLRGGAGGVVVHG